MSSIFIKRLKKFCNVPAGIIRLKNFEIAWKSRVKTDKILTSLLATSAAGCLSSTQNDDYFLRTLYVTTGIKTGLNWVNLKKWFKFTLGIDASEWSNITNICQSLKFWNFVNM